MLQAVSARGINVACLKRPICPMTSNCNGRSSGSCAAFAACCFAVLPVDPVGGQPAASITVVRAERLLDPRSGKVLAVPRIHSDQH